MQNTLKYNECRRIWLYKTFKIEIQKGRANNSDILQNSFPPDISSPLFNLYQFENPETSTPASYKMHWGLINDEEFRSKKLFKLENRRGDQIIQTFCNIGSPQKLGPPSLISRNFNTLKKILLIHEEWTEI